MTLKFKPIFKNLQSQKKFEDEGYCILKLNNFELIKEFEIIKNQYFNAITEGFFLSHYNDNKEVNQKISNELIQKASSELSNHFENFDSIIAHYILKSGLHKEPFNLHQDWSYVDEVKELPIQIWIPLQATNKENGGLFILPKSHLNFKPRSAYFGINMHETTTVEKENLVSLNLKIGEFVCYHPGVFHGSYPNSSSVARNAVLIAMSHKNTQLYYFDKPTNGKSLFTKKEIEKEFFLGDHYKIQNT